MTGKMPCEPESLAFGLLGPFSLSIGCVRKLSRFSKRLFSKKIHFTETNDHKVSGHENQATELTIEEQNNRSAVGSLFMGKGFPSSGSLFNENKIQHLNPSHYKVLGQELCIFIKQFQTDIGPNEIRKMQNFLKDKMFDDVQFLPVLNECLYVIQQIENSPLNGRIAWSQMVTSRIGTVFSEASTSIALEFVGGYASARWGLE